MRSYGLAISVAFAGWDGDRKKKSDLYRICFLFGGLVFNSIRIMGILATPPQSYPPKK